MRLFLSLFLILPLLFVPGESAAAENQLKPVTLQLQWKYQFEFAGYIAAKEKGFYLKDYFPLGAIMKTQVNQNLRSSKHGGSGEDRFDIDDFVYHLKTTLALTEEEENYLAEQGRLKLCIDPNWMPFEALAGGKHTGMAADYFRIFSAEINTPIEVVPSTSWEETLHLARNRECDILSLALETRKRKQYMDFTKPYIETPLVIAATLEKSFIYDIESLHNKRLGIVQGYALTEIVRERYPNIELVGVRNIHEGLQQVLEGKLFGFIDALPPTSYEIQKHFSGELKIIGKFDEQLQLAVGTRNDEPILHAIFNKLVGSLTPAQQQEILNRWISVSYEQINPRSLYRAIGASLLLIAALFVPIIFWQRTQNRKMRLAQQATREMLESFVTLFNSALEGILIVKKGKIVEVNDALTDRFHMKKEDFIGKSHFDFVAPEYLDTVLKKMHEDRNEPYEIEVIDASGERIPVMIRGQNVQLHGEPARIITIVDIRLQKFQQKRLEKSNVELNRLATFDELTGLANRRHFEEVMHQQAHLHELSDQPISLLVIDVDRFKQINDSFGHLAGDRVLKELSLLIKSVSRKEDLTARWGGEEFVILMPDTGLDSARRFAERLRNAIQEHDFPEIGSVTVSTGVAEHRKHQDTTAWFNNADHCLYRAKQEGRNRVIAASA